MATSGSWTATVVYASKLVFMKVFGVLHRGQGIATSAVPEPPGSIRTSKMSFFRQPLQRLSRQSFDLLIRFITSLLFSP